MAMKKYVVRVVLAGESEREQVAPQEPAVSTEFLMALRDSGAITIHDSTFGRCFDINCPRDMNEYSGDWAEKVAKKLSSLGLNAVKAPSTT